MTKTSQIRVRLEPEIKDKASAILKELGLTMSDAIAIYMRQIINKKGIPFPLRIPSDELRDAIDEYENGDMTEIDDFDAYTASVMKEVDEDA